MYNMYNVHVHVHDLCVQNNLQLQYISTCGWCTCTRSVRSLKPGVLPRERPMHVYMHYWEDDHVHLRVDKEPYRTPLAWKYVESQCALITDQVHVYTHVLYFLD